MFDAGAAVDGERGDADSKVLRMSMEIRTASATLGSHAAMLDFRESTAPASSFFM